MAEKGYNGWKNYETWAVKLWMDNEESSYRYWRDITSKTDDPAHLARYMKEHFEQRMPLVEGMWSDLLSAALSEVDWYEIAEAQAMEWLEENHECSICRRYHPNDDRHPCE